MNERKFCQYCGTVISDADNSDCNWYRHIALKYCPECRKLSDKQKTALRVYNFKKRKKQRDKCRDEQLELLKTENELLRQRIADMREQIIN